MLRRRGFIAGLVGLVAAPAIVRASSIMPVNALKLVPFDEIKVLEPQPVNQLYPEMMEHIREQTAAMLGIPADALQSKGIVEVVPRFSVHFIDLGPAGWGQRSSISVLTGYSIEGRLERVDLPNTKIDVIAKVQAVSLHEPMSVHTHLVEQHIGPTSVAAFGEFT